MFSMLKVCLYGNKFILYMKVFWTFPLHVKFKSKKKKMFSTNIPFIFFIFCLHCEQLCLRSKSTQNNRLKVIIARLTFRETPLIACSWSGEKL